MSSPFDTLSVLHECPARQPVFFLSHGGGPWPFMSGNFRDLFRELERSLQDIPHQLPERPRAVLIVTGHWEETGFSVSAGAWPGMIHDYSGFPEDMYRIRYPAPGHPILAVRVAEKLGKAGWQVNLDPYRGFDHGAYSLLKPIYPAADMPVVQLSMRRSLDAAEHFAVGQALAPLRDEGVLILGSGQSFHNLAARGPQARAASERFDTWLRQVILQVRHETRREALLNWTQAPEALVAHPRADHLIPLMVAAGAAGSDSAVCVFGDYIAGTATSGYRFGGDPFPSGFDALRLHERQTPFSPHSPNHPTPPDS